jgi:acyl-CoA synthetase (AMP-forming)/AMP-acid ligase II
MLPRPEVSLAPIFIDEFRESFPEVNFIVMYGQTEATARLSYLPHELYEKKKDQWEKEFLELNLL